MLDRPGRSAYDARLWNTPYPGRCLGEALRRDHGGIVRRADGDAPKLCSCSRVEREAVSFGGVGGICAGDAAACDAACLQKAKSCRSGCDTCGTGEMIPALLIFRRPLRLWPRQQERASRNMGTARQLEMRERGVLEALGVRIDLPFETIGKGIREIGMILVCAAAHTAARFAMPARKQLGVRTVFNLLGPLTNPAQAQSQVLAFSRRMWWTWCGNAGGARHRARVCGARSWEAGRNLDCRADDCRGSSRRRQDQEVRGHASGVWRGVRVTERRFAVVRWKRMPLQFGEFCRVIAKMKRTGRAETLWRSMALPRWLPWALLKISVTAQQRLGKRLKRRSKGQA